MKYIFSSFGRLCICIAAAAFVTRDLDIGFKWGCYTGIMSVWLPELVWHFTNRDKDSVITCPACATSARKSEFIDGYNEN